MRKKDVISIIAIIGIILWIVLSYTVTVKAEPEYVDPVRMRITCYLPTGNKTADGTVPYEGICAAKRDWIGKVAVVYTEDMEYIGTFEIRDTGGHKRIKNGTSIDIFRDNMSRAKEWVKTYGDYGYVQIMDADG